MAADGPKLPVAVGLCPVHAQEFYMPFTDPATESRRCPQMGCDEELVIYTQAEQHAT